MSTKDRIKQDYITQKGILTGFISIQKPSIKFNKKGTYQASILISKEEGEALVDIIKNIRKEQFKKTGKGTQLAEITQCIPYFQVDEETGEKIVDKEGRYLLKTGATAYVKNMIPDVKIPVIDAKCKPISDISIGEGSIARLALSLEGYSTAGKTGVSVKLKACQIIQLVEYSTSNKYLKNFSEEEGFDCSEYQKNTDTPCEEAPEEEEEADF